MADSSIPGFREIADWPPPVVRPLRIASHGAIRGGGYELEMKDAAEQRFNVFFDSCLGRLCYSSGYEWEKDEDAAFVTPDGEIARDVLSLADNWICDEGERHLRLKEVITTARHWM
ncbi:hypothetical protein [Blastopirellula marina]|uniref:Uncharacterized protein n=1 Tax=Blastopirellula marina TaxID=124 RepID=A0A2S8GR11_9BACT|nr:hypothetical protein [Blastopirellula marina]PQO46464.1 hypothetical protein C5Y93_08250 [Blastopirellula marina]